MNYYHSNIESLTLANTNFRQVLYTGYHAQLVLMSLRPGEEIGAEVHDSIDQFFRLEQGSAKFVIDGDEFEAKADEVVIVPAGANHNVIATGTEDLKLYTLYSPPNHPPGTVQATKAEAKAAETAEHHQ